MLTQKLLAVTNTGADWVLWLLVFLSVVSVAVMLERAAFFLARRIGDPDAVARRLLAGVLAGARQAVEGRRRMEADVVRAAIDHGEKGPDAVVEVVHAEIE